MKYVVFLRGINVGGNRMVSMAKLKNEFENLGFTNVKTLLASGNVVFETSKNTNLQDQIEKHLHTVFGFDIDVIIRSNESIIELIQSNPFNGIPVTENTHLYVTFLSVPQKSTFTIPYQSPDKHFKILSVSDTEICSVLTVTKTKGTTDVMKILEKEFGRRLLPETGILSKS